MKLKPFIIPANIIDDGKAGIDSLKPGEYKWGTVFADMKGRAFVYRASHIQDAQDQILAPHFLIRHQWGFNARLFTQRVRRLDADVILSIKLRPGVIILEEVEL